MHEELITPNWHVVLLHYPLGLLAMGVFIELLSLFWRASTVRLAGRWMILIGALACIPTTTLGLYAFRDVVSSSRVTEDSTWKQVVAASPWTPEQWDHMVTHLWFAVAGTGLAVFASVVWLACSDAGRRRFYFPALLLLVLALGCLNVGAWFSGEGVYRHGVGVATDARQTHVDTALSATAPAGETIDRVETTRAAEPGHRLPRTVEGYIPPLQLHVLLAGMTVAIALGAMGATIRRWMLLRPHVVPVVPAGALVEIPEHRLRPDLVGHTPDVRPVVVAMPTIYPARVWFWGFVFGLGTIAAGLWMTHDWELNVIREPLRNEFAWDSLQRLFTHVCLGVGIVLFLLLSAFFTRVAPRHRGFVVLLMLLLLGVITVQVWVGVLLLFDSPNGGLLRFN